MKKFEAVQLDCESGDGATLEVSRQPIGLALSIFTDQANGNIGNYLSVHITNDAAAALATHILGLVAGNASNEAQ